MSIDESQITEIKITRELSILKGLIERRKDLRNTTLYNMVNKQQQALSNGRQLMLVSQKIVQDMTPQLSKSMEELFHFKTSILKQELQYLLDNTIMCRILFSDKKRQDSCGIMQKIVFPNIPPPRTKIGDLQTNEDKIRYNDEKELHCKACAIAVAFINLCLAQKLPEFTQKFYKIYILLIQKFYGKIQLATALFKYANNLYQNSMFRQANIEYDKCINIRKRNVFNGGLVDALINSAICLRKLCMYELAIERVEAALQINKDLDDKKIATKYHLLLGKIFFQFGKLTKAYQQYLICLCQTQQLSFHNYDRIEVELDIIFFYKTLKDIAQKPKENLNVSDKKSVEDLRKEAKSIQTRIEDDLFEREGFVKYKEYSEVRLAHLNLNITQEVLDCIPSDKIDSLNKLIENLQKISYVRGVQEFRKSKVFNTTKIRDLIIKANPNLKPRDLEDWPLPQN